MTISFDLPTPADSSLRSYDARWKLASVILCLTATAALWRLGPLLAAFVASLLLCLVARMPWRWYRNRIAVLVPMLIGLYLILPFLLHNGGASWHILGVQVSVNGLIAASRVSLKSLTIVTLMLVLLATTPMPHLFKAAHYLRVPGFLIQLTALTFRYLLLLIQEFGRLRIALRVRGFRNRADLQSYRVVGNVTGTLLVRSAERAERVGQAMRCRGFDGRYRCLHEFHTTGRDLLLSLLLVGAASMLLGWDLLQR